MIFVSHLLLAGSGILLVILGRVLLRDSVRSPASRDPFSRRQMRTLGLAAFLASVLAIGFACASFRAGEGAYSMVLTIGSGAVWLFGALIGHRFFESALSARCLSLATITVAILWWVMNDGGVSAGEGFLLAGLTVWVLVSFGLELRKKTQEDEKASDNPHGSS
ncbi:MAG: hypothetical protein QM627_01535 [Luteolibacter sp.]